jgi:hypothetical protein
MTIDGMPFDILPSKDPVNMVMELADADGRHQKVS